MLNQFYYDEQIRRFLLQFTRMFSNFQVEYGRDDLGNPTYYRVPIRYGDESRQVQTILQNNSAAALPTVPIMTFYVSGLKYSRDRVQEPYYVDKKTIRQREYNPVTEQYETTQGNAFTVKKHMPVPYMLTITLDVWTSNTNQKLQLAEQILPLFNPSMEIQSTDNFLDWTSLSAVELVDVNWTSRSVPIGTENPIDIFTMRFELPIWISLPARVEKYGVIHKIIASIFDPEADALEAFQNDDLLLGTRVKVTPHGYKVLLIGNQLQLLAASAINEVKNDSYDPLSLQDSTLRWGDVFEEYGKLRDGITQIRLEDLDEGTEIIGTVGYHPTETDVLVFTVDPDTIPVNSIDPVDAVINPLNGGPGAGLPAATSGQRYLLVENIGNISDTSIASAWQGTDFSELVASTNDIIEYDGTKWNVVFDAGEISTTEYVTNLTTNIQYKWNGIQWLRSYEGLYSGGEWAVVI